MKHLMIALSLLAGSSMIAVDTADAKASWGRRRLGFQQKRIGNGIKSGSLTAREVVKLEAQQARIVAGAARAKADGEVTRKEKWKGFRAQNRASRNIFRYKHNRRRR